MTTDIYKTKLGTKFRFGFEQREKNGEKNFVIFILDQPDYGGRPDDPHTTHRVREGEKYLINYSGPVPTLDDAKLVAACFSDQSELYITTGQPFPEG